MGWELQNISTASFSFKLELSVADGIVLSGTGSQTANYDNLTWFMIVEKCRRKNDMLNSGLLGLVTDGSSLQTWRSPGTIGQGEESQCFTQRKDFLLWLLLGLSPEKITPMDWRGPIMGQQLLEDLTDWQGHGTHDPSQGKGHLGSCRMGNSI